MSVWTVIVKDVYGDYTAMRMYGSSDRAPAWQQAAKESGGTPVAILKGDHAEHVHTEHYIR